MSAVLVPGVGSRFGSGRLGLLGPGVGSGSSSSTGVNTPARMTSSPMSSLEMSTGVFSLGVSIEGSAGLVWVGVVTVLRGAFLSSQATSGASTGFPLSGPPT